MKVAVIGLGYVGMPLVYRLSSVGAEVTAYDISPEVVEKRRESYTKLSNVNFTSDPNDITGNDYVVLCVPTPTKQGEPDLTCLTDAFRQASMHCSKGATICVESTVNCGVTRRLAAKHLVVQEMAIGKDVYVVYSPEREDPANELFTLKNTPKIVSGMTPACLEKGMELYRTIVDVPVPVSSLEVAEAVKCLENSQRLVNIGLMNEYKKYTDTVGIDIFEVIDAAATKPFGFTKYYPSVGVGGHCIPVDPMYVKSDAEKRGVNLHLINIASAVNDIAPEYVVSRVQEQLEPKKELGTLKNKVLVVGLTYKPNVPDVRESASLQLVSQLKLKGIDVVCYDPELNSPDVTKPIEVVGWDLMTDELYEQIDMKEHFDLVVFTVNHRTIMKEDLRLRAPMIVDTTGVYSAKDSGNNQVVRA